MRRSDFYFNTKKGYFVTQLGLHEVGLLGLGGGEDRGPRQGRARQKDVPLI